MGILRRFNEWMCPPVSALSAERVSQLAAIHGPASDAARAITASSEMRLPRFYQTVDGIVAVDEGG